MGEAENEREKILVRFHSNRTQNREFQKIEKKLKKKMKSINMPSFKAITGQDRLSMRGKKKIIVPIHSNPTRNRNSRKIAKKFKK